MDLLYLFDFYSSFRFGLDLVYVRSSMVLGFCVWKNKKDVMDDMVEISELDQMDDLDRLDEVDETHDMDEPEKIDELVICRVCMGWVIFKKLYW